MAATGALKHGQEELSHVRGQGQKLGGSHARRAAAKKSYLRGRRRSGAVDESARLQWCRNCREELPSLRSRAATGRSYPASEVRVWPGGATPSPRSGAAAGRSYPTPKARGGGRQDQPHVQRAMAAQAQEGREELPPTGGQGQRLGGATHTRGPGCCPEDQPQVQGAVAVWAQEGLEELTHVKGLEGWQ